MRKLFIFLMLVFMTIEVKAQTWKPNNPIGIIYSDSNMTVIVTMKDIITHENTVDIVLYDSTGQPIREWKRLALHTREEEVAYRIIYKHITEKKGWIKIRNTKLPTMREEEYD